MKRGVITNDGTAITISSSNVWITAWEIADLFHTSVGRINAAIKESLRNKAFKGKPVCNYIRLENGYYADTYNLEMVIALSFHFNTVHAQQFRQWVISKITVSSHNEPAFIIHLCGNYPSY